MYINSWGTGESAQAGHHPLGAVIHISETERERRIQRQMQGRSRHPGNNQGQRGGDTNEKKMEEGGLTREYKGAKGRVDNQGK